VRVGSMVASNRRGVGVWALLGGGRQAAGLLSEDRSRLRAWYGLSFPSNVNVNVEPWSVVRVSLCVKAGTGP
jgi:hypothetical protein